MLCAGLPVVAPTGLLRLNGGGDVQELMVVQGQCFLSESHPSSHRLRRALANHNGHPETPDAEAMEAIRQLAVELGRQRLHTTFRFRQVQPDSSWVGPISSAQLLMEVAVLRSQ